MNTLAPRMQRASGESRVAFALRDGETRLTDLYQRDPCRILFPDPEPGEPPQAVLVTTSGGIAGGDVLKMAVEVGPGGHFFGCAHTQARYRTAFFAPMISDWRNYESWREGGSPTAYDTANRLYKERLAAFIGSLPLAPAEQG